MYRKLKKKILYAPLFTSMLLMSGGAAQSQETAVDFKNKIIELEQRISGLESLKQELQELKKNLEKKEEKVLAKEEKLVSEIKSIKSLRKSMSVREARPATTWHMAGYADVGFEAISGDNNDSFLAGKFNPAFHFQFKDWIMFESELEITTSGEGVTEIVMEYSQLNFLVHDNVTLVVGKYLSPIGQFQERLHPSWINRSMNPPAGFGHGGIQPASEVGVMLRGGVPLADEFTFSYSLSVGNGPRFGHDDDELELEGIGVDNDSSKAFGGRLAMLHKSSLELGFSYLTSGVNSKAELLPDGDMGLARKGDYRLWGADMAYTKGNWDIRAEYLNAQNSPSGGIVAGGFEEVNWEAWYSQLAYRLSGLLDSPALGKLEPVIRYGEFRADVGNELQLSAEKRWNIGINYWLAPSIVVKTGIERRNYILANRADETRYKVQMAYGF
ncbi:MAG: OprO/OprP family phosphate-selective porin [Emcibacter sp.]|nr:OprO/OprP family phosphate-selective porin [Emcibacter sp.]